MPWLEDLTAIAKPPVQAISAAVTFHTSSVSALPSSIDAEFVRIQETGGVAPVKIHNQARPKYERPSAQLEFTAKTYARARSMARAAYNAIGEKSNVTIGGTFYKSISAVQAPFDLGPDAAGRARCAFNVNGEFGTS
jgi:uncharacterized protein YkwD